MTFRPRKDWVVTELTVEGSDETQAQLEAAGIELLEYSARYGQYRIRLTKADLAKNQGPSPQPHAPCTR